MLAWLALRRRLCSSLAQPRKLLVVQPRLHPPALLKARLLEALRLAQSLEKGEDEQQQEEESESSSSLPSFVLAHSSHRGSKPSRVHAGAFFGEGTIDNVRIHIDALDVQRGVDTVFVNVSLSGAQQRNLERAWNKPVLDRVGIIIEIFGTRARTKEAKLQVELASLDYKKSRLVRAKGGRQGFGVGGQEQVVSARGRASGGQGFTSGAGETEIQLQRRRLAEKKTKLQAMLTKVRQTRSLQRSGRKGFPLVAVVGYTNAGKSTLVARLSKSKLYADDRLFATLDAQLRSVYLPTGTKVLLSDTVGFISDLPIQLVEAFRATLEEVLEADVLLHVMDSSAPDMEEQRVAVLQVLKEIGVSQERLEKDMIEVLNKVDIERDESSDSLIDPSLMDPEEGFGEESSEEQEAADEEAEEPEVEEAEAETEKEPEEIWGTHSLPNKIRRIPVSATKGIGIQNLLDAIGAKVGKSASKEEDVSGLE